MRTNDNRSSWVPFPCRNSVQEDHGYNYAERMYEVIPAAYLTWKVLYFALFTLTLIYMMWDCYLRISYLRKHQRPYFDYRTTVYGILTVSCTLRCLWCLDPHWKSSPGPHLFGNNVHTWVVINALMAKLPQVGLMISVLMQVELWRTTVKRSQRLQGVQMNATNNRPLQIKIFILCFIFTTAAICDILSKFFPSIGILKQVYNVVGGLVFLVLSVAGFRYARDLSKMIHAMHEEGSGSPFKMKALTAVRKVRAVIYILLSLVAIVLVSLALRFSTNVCYSEDQLGANIKMLIFTALFHSTEIIGFLALTYSVSQKQDHRLKSIHSLRMNSELSSEGRSSEETSMVSKAVKKVASSVRRLARSLSSAGESESHTTTLASREKELINPRKKNTWALGADHELDEIEDTRV